MKKPCVLVVAGTDPTGGAGITRDIAALEFFNVNPAIAISAINVQNNNIVSHIELTSPELLAAQINCAMQSQEVAAIKIGMLGSIENVEVINKSLQSYSLFCVLDPVMKSSSGYRLSYIDIEQYIGRLLLNKISLLTPNLPELGLFAQEAQAASPDQAIAQGKKIMHKYGLRAMLIKGGHMQFEGEAIDILLTLAEEPQYFTNKFLPRQMRGTGCALASAIAALVATGQSLPNAVHIAKSYVHNLIDHS